jgi:glutathionyl-hydroquinone reductase|tara:strand:+ start:7993 stop:8190 length:198 start_codon:yes stop_codon:yes gene_type:complete
MKLKEKVNEWVMDKVKNPETKAKVVAKWNESVNIPILTEKTEEKIFSAIYDAVVNVFEKVFDEEE